MDCCLGWHKSLSQPTSFLRRLLPHVLLKKQLHQRQAQRRYTENRVKEKKTRENLIFFMLAVAYTCVYAVVSRSNSSIVFEDSERKRASEGEREREKIYMLFYRKWHQFIDP